MKNFKLLSLVITMIITLFIGKCIVNASNTITIAGRGNIITLKSDYSIVGKAETIGYTTGIPYFPVKHRVTSNDETIEEGNLYCTSGFLYSAPAEDLECTQTNWSGNEGYGVAYIISRVKQNENKKTYSFSAQGYSGYDRYYWTELLILSYMDKFDGSEHSAFKTSVMDNSTYKVLKTGLTYNQIINEAKAYAEKAVKPTIGVYVDGVKTNNAVASLTFEEANDGYYYSEPIKFEVDDDVTIKFIDVKNPDGIFKPVKQSDGNYVVKVASGDIKIGEEISFSINVSASRTVNYSERYDCGSSYQAVALATTEEHTKTSTFLLNGSATKSKATIGITKVNENGDIVEGAQLILQTESQKKLDKGEGIKFTSGLAGNFIKGLIPGKYYLSEIEAPVGYNKFQGHLEIVIDDQGNVTVDGKETNYARIKIENSRTATKFSKISVVNKKELPGATLTILNENKEVITDEYGNALYEWVSTDKPHYIYGLPVGNYYLKEVKAPEGYALSEEIVPFAVKDDGNITEVIMENALEVEVPDTLSSKSILLLFIGMFDVALGIGVLLYVKKNKITE